jgi:hypothetical protein
MMKKYATLDRELLDSVKEAFVAMPAGADPSLGAGPVAGGGMLTQAQAAPMGGTPPMDPAMMGGAPPMDPAMMGGALPMDPAMMGGGMPPAGGELPPEAMGALPPEAAAALTGGGAGGGITLTVDDLIRLVEGIIGATKTRKAAPAAGGEAAPAAGGEAAPAANGGAAGPMGGAAGPMGGAGPMM